MHLFVRLEDNFLDTRKPHKTHLDHLGRNLVHFKGGCGRCNREKPPCKYFHPPQHLKDQLLINGRNHLALKNALMQQMGIAPGQPVIPGQVQTVVN
uniref:Muscleblind-like CCCH zinc finger domain-containing protein n=1 Tax=Lutzomyia longipalpis TaxID=7200 RepID=A0A1B0CIL4_LUTLO